MTSENVLKESAGSKKNSIGKKSKLKIKSEVAAEVKSPKRTNLRVRVVGGSLAKAEKTEELFSRKNEEKEIAPAEEKEKKSSSKKLNLKTKAGSGEKHLTGGKEKDFFKKMNHKAVRENKEKEKKEEEKKEKESRKEKNPRSIGLYRNIAFTFITFTILLVAIVFCLYFVKLTIEVSPKKERISDKLSFTVANEGVSVLSGKSYLSGAVEQIPVKKEKVFPSTGAEVLGKEIIGSVAIYNTTGEDKTLVATTRLLSPEGKLFRIKEQVNVPKNGSVKVQIYTDEPSEDLALKPTNFTIPGLWAGLQDKIYAKSSEAFVYNTQIQKYIQQVDVEKSLQDLKAALLDEISQQFGNNYKGFDKVIFEIDKNSMETGVSAKVGDKVDEFTISLKAKVNVVAFKKADAEKFIGDKLASTVPADKKIVGLEQDSIEYNLVSADFSSSQSVIEASFVGSMTAKKNETLVDRKKLIGLNEAQIRDYLSGSDKLSDFKIIFSPSFMKKAPSLVDRIKVIVK